MPPSRDCTGEHLTPVGGTEGAEHPAQPRQDHRGAEHPAPLISTTDKRQPQPQRSPCRNHFLIGMHFIQLLKLESLYNELCNEEKTSIFQS